MAEVRLQEGESSENALRRFKRKVMTKDITKDGRSCNFFPGRNALVSSLCIADGIRVLLGEEGHSDSDFFLILFDDSLQEGNKFLFLLGIVLRVVYGPTDLSHKFHVIHESLSPNGGFYDCW